MSDFLELDFHKVEFQNNGRLLNISQTVVEQKLFGPKMDLAIFAGFLG